MATIQETIDNPTPANMAEQQGPGYKLVRVAEANSRPDNMLNGILKIMGVVAEVLLLRALRVFQLWQVITYVALLVWTSTLNGAGTSSKLFALSQLLDLSEYCFSVDRENPDLMLQFLPLPTLQSPS